MHIDILRCDWCGSESKYEPHHYTFVKYVRFVAEWAHSQTEEYDICLECRGLFSTFIVNRMQLQKVDAE